MTDMTHSLNDKLDEVLDELASRVECYYRNNNTSIYSAPDDYRRYIAEAKDQLLTIIESARVAGNWWVTNHDALEDNKKVSGPYSTNNDAAKAREILERFEQHHNYWIEPLKENQL